MAVNGNKLISNLKIEFIEMIRKKYPEYNLYLNKIRLREKSHDKLGKVINVLLSKSKIY